MTPPALEETPDKVALSLTDPPTRIDVDESVVDREGVSAVPVAGVIKDIPKPRSAANRTTMLFFVRREYSEIPI